MRAKAQGGHDMDGARIIEGINRFSRWHYQIDLDGHKTPIFDATNNTRHDERRNYFFRPLVQMLGGSLAGKRVLDLGCNAGFWSLAAIEAGCDYVLGIDGRTMHVEQANFVFEVKGVERRRYDFRRGNIFDVLSEKLGSFDVVLCLGLLYHVSKPMTLLERIAALNTDVLVIDTTISKNPGPGFELWRESREDPRNAVDYDLVFVPSREAVRELVHQFGYDAVVLKPQFSSYAGANDYLDGARRAFICSRQTNLDALVAEREDWSQVATVPHIDVPVPPSCFHEQVGVLDIPARQLARAIVLKAARRMRLLTPARCQTLLRRAQSHHHR
jgi:2-polyprenyl-3-methyl-5-hydroxy-6-metoxy-1,4-benzoquinol methylase